jgi:hyperosmotically inducible protein
MDRNADNIPDEAQSNMPGSAASRTKQTLETGEQLAKNAAITGRIKASLLADKSMHATKINVDTVDGVVTLKGEVPAEAEKKRAEEVALKTPGVASVNNELIVSPSQAEEGKPPASPHARTPK